MSETLPAPQTRQVGAEAAGEPAIWRPSAALNPQRMDYLWALSEKIAAATVVPESLKKRKEGNVMVDLDWPEVLGNVFAVVEQADRWNISPFALLGCAAIVHGKLGFEGKVIATVLETNYGIKLHSYFTGTPETDDYHIYLCDEVLPEDVRNALKPGYRHPLFDILDGSVSEWKTTGSGTPWRPKTYGKMLVYRGTREWARVYKPAAMMGVLADDEIEDFRLERAAAAANDITTRFAVPPRAGFNPDNIKQIEQNGQTPMAPLTTGTDGKEPAKTEPKEPAGAKTKAEPKAEPATGSGGQLDLDQQQQQTPSSSTPQTTQGDAAGGEARTIPPYRLSAEEFQSYHSALARMTSSTSIGKADQEHWKLSRPPKHADDQKLCKDIWENHKHRADGKITLEAINKELPAWIAQVTGSAK